MIIPEYYVEDKLPRSLSRHPTSKVILKYKNHPGIKIIKSFFMRFSSSYFLQVDKNTVLKEVKKLNMNKAVQNKDFPVKILKENTEYFVEYVFLQFNEAICASKFPASFKFANVTLFSHKVQELKMIIIGQSFYLLSQKYLRRLFVDNFQVTLITFFRNFNMWF